MLFGLSNSSEVFMDLMTSVLQTYLDKFVTVLVDDILIYSRSQEEYEAEVRITLQTLGEHKVYAKLFKCELWLSEVVFLGHMLSLVEISVDPGKLSFVTSLPPTQS